MNQRAPKLLVALFLSIAVPSTAHAQAEPSGYDKVWRFAEWYVNDANPVVQSVRFSGRFQYEYATVSDDDLTHDEWNVRRMRLGIKSELFDRITVHVEAEFNPQEADPFFMRLTDTYVSWSSSPVLEVTLGKQSAPFTADGANSSKELLTIDRSNLSNNMWFPQEYMPGFTLSGEAASWVYHAGVYSSGAQNREFGRFDGGVFTLLALGYDLSEAISADEALLTANYVYQDPDANNSFTRQLEHVTSLNLRVQDGPWGVRADVSAAAGYLGQSDLWGTMIMPFFNVTPSLQFVARHTYLSSADPNGVRLARYESQLVAGRGDRYKEIYLGSSYYVYGHKLKLQGGVQFGDMQDSAADGGAYSGVAATMGLRISW